MKVKIKYLTDIEPLNYIGGSNKSNWIDMRSAKDIEIKANEYALIPLGIAMEIPDGYEAHVVPRSSTFKTWGIIQTNGTGIIDNSYKGDNDQWFMPVYATRNTVIKKNDRVCQFRIIENQPTIEFITVDCLGNSDRGGEGSTGTN